MKSDGMKALTGAYAIAEAMRQIEPDVVAAYPITPQTPIVEQFAKFVANGVVRTKMIRVESEHSAMSACIGACAAGARAMTATSSAGLALMWEMLGVASGLRLPIVMAVANRALSAPINIHCDHSDSMGARDHGWIQIYSENAQEAYDNFIMAVKIAEHRDVMLPVMVMQDGFITSHGVQNVTLLEDNIVGDFVGSYEPPYTLLDTKNPVTFGSIQLQDFYFETKRQQEHAMETAKSVIKEVADEFWHVSKRRYGYFERYKLEDAEAVIVTMSSTAGTTKAVIDRMRARGKKVGLLKIRVFRPFPYKEIAAALKDTSYIGVLDRSMSYGAYPPLYTEIRNALYSLTSRPKVQSYVFGLGGREITENEIENVFNELLEGELTESMKYIGCRGEE